VTDLKRETTMMLSEGDVCDIMTEALCRYGPLDALKVVVVNREDDASFTIHMAPKPEESA
jgi:hypothetical protein